MLLLEDIQGGGLTIRAPGIDVQPGVMASYCRQGGCVSGTTIARQMLTSLRLVVGDMMIDGEQVSAEQ